MKMLSNKKIHLILVWSILFLPGTAFASTVYIDAQHSEFFVGDTILFSVRIDSENKNINAVDGDILLDHAADTVSLTDINTSGSKFSLWPGKPLPSEWNTSISFAGGSPGGLISNDAIVFNIALKLQKEGPITLTPDTLSVYLHDGKGTKDTLHVRGLAIEVLPRKQDSQPVDDWSAVTLNDTAPPEPFEIYLGQEGSVFEGKKFLSFNTTDAQSGIAHYEVAEGDLPLTRSQGTYVLQEQNKPVQVTVIAYDSAGNARESVYISTPSPTPYTFAYPIIVLIFVVLVLVLVLIFVMYKKRRGFPKNKSVQDE